MSDALTDELLQMEHRFWESSTDPDVYREHLADDGVMVFPYGVGAMDKQMVLYAVSANAERWETHDLTSVRVVPLGDDAAVISYLARAERGDGAPFEAWVSSIYARRSGRWVLVLHQQTLAAVTASGH